MRFMPVRNNGPQDAATVKLGATSLKKLVRSCCQAFLVLGQNKSVIKRADLTKLVRNAIPSCSITPHAMKGIINLACKELSEVMGIRVFETDQARDKYLLVNNRYEYNDYHNYSEEESDELIVLFLMMVSIFTTPDEAASEQELRDAVRTIVEKDEDYKKILDSLFKKLYLVQTRDPNQPEVRLISWGPRAHAETNPDNFMQSFMQLVDQGKAEDWPEQLRRMEKLKSLHTSVNVDPET